MVPRPTPSPEPAETFPLAIGHSLIDVPRLWTGLWQLSSPAWGTAPAARIRKEMLKHVSKGFTAFGTRLVFYSSCRHRPLRSLRRPRSSSSTVHRPRSPRSPRSPLLMIPRLTTPLDMVRFFLALHVPFTIHIYVDVSIKLPKTDVGCHLLSRPRLSRVSCVL